MSIKTKNAGAYADIVGVFHKRAGAYEAVQCVYAKAGGVYGRVDAAPLPDPTTVNYTGTQIKPGFAGSLSTTSIAGRITGRASLTAWVGVITGTEAKLTSYNGAGTSATDGQIVVSVDGGAFTNATRVGALFTLFSGLEHGPHKVVFRYGSAFGNNANIPESSTALEVTGQPPSITIPSEWVQPGSFGSLSIADAATAANAANFSPELSISYGVTYGSNVPSVRIRGAFTRLYVAKNSQYVYVSKDGATPTRYGPITETNTPVNGNIIDLDGSLSTYNVWGGAIVSSSGGGTFGAGGNAALQDIGDKRRLDQYGDSITFGAGATSPGDVETMRVAAAIGFTGSTCGISGYTIAQLDTLLTTVLPRRTITGSDVAVVAIGRNNTGGAFDAAETTGYQSIISKLLAAGYGTVLCRGLLPHGDLTTTWPAENGSIQSIVTGLANPNVKFVDTSGYPAYSTAGDDKTHPTDAGYATLAPYVEASYRTALGL